MAGFSDRARAIKPTGIRRMFDMAGDDAIQFGLGEPDFQPPTVAIDEFYNAMLNGKQQMVIPSSKHFSLIGLIQKELQQSQIKKLRL